MRALSLIIMVIFVITLFPVYSSNPDNIDTINPARLRVANAQRLANLTADQQLNAARSLRAVNPNLKNISSFSDLIKRQEFTKYNELLQFKARTLESTRTAEENFLKAKENYLVAKVRFTEQKNNFLELKKQWGSCSGEECTNLEEHLFLRAKEGLLTIADRILEHLRMISSRIESNEYLSEDQAETRLNYINDLISAFEKFKNDIDAAENKEELKEARKSIHDKLKEVVSELRLSLAVSQHSRISGILLRAKHLEEKIDKIVERMREHEKDTSSIEPLVDELKEKLESVVQSAEMTKEKFDAAREIDVEDEKRILIDEGKEALEDAKEALKEANQKLREILSMIREQAREEEQEIESEEVGE